MTTNRSLRNAAATQNAVLQLQDLDHENVLFLEAENLSRENDLARVKLLCSSLVQFLMLALFFNQTYSLSFSDFLKTPDFAGICSTVLYLKFIQTRLTNRHTLPPVTRKNYADFVLSTLYQLSSLSPKN